MKRIIFIISILALLCGCMPEAKVLDITGEWRLTDLELTKSVQIGNEEVDVYISYSVDNTFEMWQFLGAGRYEYFSGTWALTEDILTGKYTDGTNLGNVYKVTCEADILTMTATVNSSDIYTYSRTTIPESIK